MQIYTRDDPLNDNDGFGRETWILIDRFNLDYFIKSGDARIGIIICIAAAILNIPWVPVGTSFWSLLGWTLGWILGRPEDSFELMAAANVCGCMVAVCGPLLLLLAFDQSRYHLKYTTTTIYSDGSIKEEYKYA